MPLSAFDPSPYAALFAVVVTAPILVWQVIEDAKTWTPRRPRPVRDGGFPDTSTNTRT